MRIRHLIVASPLAIAVAAAPAHAADYVTTVDSLNPVANFRLTTPGDPSQVNGYTTTYSATTGTTAPGGGAPIASDPTNTAATFAGNNAAPSEVNTSLSGMIPGKGTINAWINLAALPGTAGSYFYVAGESQGGNDFDLQLENDNRLYIFTGGGENTSAAYDPDYIDQWHMVTASYDGTLGANSFRNLYIDGVEVATYTGGVNGADKSQPFTIGYSDVFGGRDFDGAIDEVAVFGYGLDSDQVAAIYASASDAGGATGAVPEPAIWATMLAGFGMVGAGMRRRAGRTVQAI